MIPGLDLLGIGSKKWNMKQTIKGFPQGFALGLFADETFGPLAIKNTTKLLKTGKVGAVRAHLNWAGPNPSHALPPLSKIKKLAPKWEALAKQFPSVQFYISPTCEGKSNDKAKIKELLDLTASLCPSCSIVWSPMQSPSIPGYITEVHGKAVAKTGMIASYDGGTKGEALFDIDAAKWVKQQGDAIMAFAWGALCNMAEAHNTLPPNKRTASPDAGYIQSLARLFDDPGVAPTPSFPVTPLKKPQLFKTHAEDSPGKDKRHNRPLVILKEKLPHVELVTKDGAVLGKMRYYAPIPPNQRYYSGNPGSIGLYGWQIADKALAVSGSPYVWIKVGGKFYGPINPIFRTPYFQA